MKQIEMNFRLKPQTPMHSVGFGNDPQDKGFVDTYKIDSSRKGTKSTGDDFSPVLVVEARNEFVEFSDRRGS
jgi:hypothetical protein